MSDRYVHGPIDRRAFLQGAGKVAVGGLTAAGMLEILSPAHAAAQQIAKDDKRLKTEYVQYDSAKGYGAVKAYLARPAAASGKLPGVVVCHDDHGLNPYAEDVARRTALAGYVVLAPDALTSLGGYPGDENKGAEMFKKLDPPKILEDFIAGEAYLKTHSECTGKVGAVGFGFGADVGNELAARIRDLAAAISFYGEPPTDEETARIKAAMVLHYAETDVPAVNDAETAFETNLENARVPYASYKYPGTQRGFHDDTSPKYNKEAAELAWQRTIVFLERYLH